MDRLSCALCFSCFRVCSLLPCACLLGGGWPLGSCWLCLLYICYFPGGVLGRVWHLIVSFPDLCRLSDFILVKPVVLVFHIYLNRFSTITASKWCRAFTSDKIVYSNLLSQHTC